MSRGARAVFFLLLSCACISTNRAIRPGGDSSKITLKDRMSLGAELLAVTTTDLYFVSNRQVWRTPLADVASVRVEGYGLQVQRYVTLGLYGAADVVLSAYLASVGCWQGPVLFIPLYLVGVASSLSGIPHISFQAPLDDGTRCQLALYCRYPRSLTDAQWQELLRFYHQDTFLSPGDLLKP
jgi:hypothetical protein